MNSSFVAKRGPVLLGAMLAAGSLFAAAPLQAQSVDLDVIFNCNADGPIGNQTPEECLETRSTLLNSCTACHTFVPIVKAQKDVDGWNATLGIHRSRVPEMSDEQFEALRGFLQNHFNETLPPPALPPALEALGAGLPA